MKYQAVIFDLFGTLVRDIGPKEYDSMLNSMADSLDIPQETFRKMWNSSTGRLFSGKAKDTESFLANLLVKNDFDPPNTGIRRALHIWQVFIEEELVPYEESLEVLSTVKDKGLKTGLITNCFPVIPKVFQSCPLSETIDHAVFSSDVGVKKPDKQIYDLASKGVGAPPESCLYVGNGYGRELSGATNAGMTAVLVDRNEPVFPHFSWEGTDWTGLKINNLREVLERLDSDEQR